MDSIGLSIKARVEQIIVENEMLRAGFAALPYVVLKDTGLSLGARLSYAAFTKMQISEGANQVFELTQSLLLLLERLLRLAKTLGVGRPRLPAHSYENLFLDLTLDIKDAQGMRAVITRKQLVHFLTDEA